MKKYIDIVLKQKNTIGRITMMIVYVWFGLPKLFGASSAETLVTDLSEKLLPFIPSETFLIFLGLFEVLLGIGFLIPKLTKYVVPIFWLHMLTTFAPLIFLAGTTWSRFGVPSLEGQYILKNIVLISLSLFIYEEDREKE